MTYTGVCVFLSLVGVSLSSNWVVHIHTADQDDAGTNSDVFIKMFGSNGEISSEIKLSTLFQNNFKRGCIDTFKIKQEHIKAFTDNTNLERIELWKLKDSSINSWKIDSVVIENQIENNNFLFPVIRWIESGRHYIFSLYDTSLPQNEEQTEQRTSELNETRQEYEFSKVSGLDAVRCKNVPVDEKLSRADTLQVIIGLTESKVKGKLATVFKGNTFESIDQIKDIFSQSDDMLPEGLDNWDDDVHFGLQRLTGNNVDIIELLQNIPDNFPVTDELLGAVLEGMTIKKAIVQKRLFICDYKILKDIQTREDFVQCAPLGLFFLDRNGHLKPIAIQMFQNSGPDNPIFTPTDSPNTWKIAKMWLNNADAAYHEAVAHLGGTHFMMEGIAVASHRNLARSHPIFKLLAPHFLYLVTINSGGVPIIVGGNGSFLDSVSNIGGDGLMELVQRSIPSWRLDVQGNLPEFLKLRGVDDPSVLPRFSFRDDGLLVYGVIRDYVREYVDIYYTDADIMESDTELQSWVQDIVRPTDAATPGCGIKGVAGNGELTTREQLAEVLTSIIWVSTGQHAAVMFKQYDQYAFPPNCPLMLHGSPPKSKDATVTEQDMLDSLPDRAETMRMIGGLKLLEIKRTNSIGDFEVDYVADPPAVKVVERFRARLREVSIKIKLRNILRDPSYSILDPDNIPNSIAG